jgi:phosphatidylinositol glycan class B
VLRETDLGGTAPAGTPKPASPDVTPPAGGWAGRAARLPLWTAIATTVVLIAGTVIRLRYAMLYQGIIYPDETYQMTEAAHRVVFGYGVIPWEFIQGLRSWAGPGFLLPPTALGARLGLDGVHLMMLVKAWVVLWAGLGTAAGAIAARRLAGPMAGLLAAGLGAFSPLSAVYDVHPLGDTVAAPLPALALALLTSRAAGRREAAWHVLAGVLVVAAVTLRHQSGVLAIGLVAAAALTRSRRRLVSLGVGLLTGAALSGLLDLLTWGVPFAPERRSVIFNIVDDGASLWGRRPALFYLDQAGSVLGPVLGALVAGGLMMALLPARRPPAARAEPGPLPTWPVVLAVMGYVGVLSAIGHKELRFLIPALPLAYALAAVGWARVVQRVRPLPRSARRTTLAALTLTAGVVGGVVLPGVRMADLGYGDDSRSAWVIDEATPRLLSLAGTLPQVCGVALVRPTLTWSGGYSYLHRHVPLATVRKTPDPRNYRAWANVILARAGKPLPMGYTEIATMSGIVLAQRAGGCAEPPPELRSEVLPPPPLPAKGL